MTECPKCERRGRSVSATTVRHQLTSPSIDDYEGFALCRSESCPVVYYRGEQVYEVGTTVARPFHKSQDPDRLVCFCFDHTVRAVQDDVRKHGTSRIQTEIRDACGQGLDECERKNPQGRCCLGDVGSVVRLVGERSDKPDPASVQPDGCCSSPAQDASLKPAVEASKPDRSGVLLASGAVMTALLSSACCWLPLMLLGLGASSAGAGAMLEAWRVPLLLVTVAALVGGFYLTYRKPRCAPGDACATPDRRLIRFNKIVLWMAAAVVVAFALFPNYITALTGDGSSAQVMSAPEHARATYSIQGMTCAGCASSVRAALESIPGVEAASVSYDEGRADVVWENEPEHGRIVAVLAGLGYDVTPVESAP